MTKSSTAADEAEVFDFVIAYEQDLGAGNVHSLSHYLARFPGYEEAIAREYLALRGAVGQQGELDEAEDHSASVGPYRLIEELGRGGQGSVWLAEDRRIARRVALKVLPPSFAALSSESRARLRREAEVVSRLDHPGICPVYEAEVDGDLPYIAMRHIAGETLAAAIGHAREEPPVNDLLALPPSTGMQLRATLRFIERAGRALHAAHEAGVVHRDVKPGNIMIDVAGEPVLLDFGQARDEHSDGAAITLSGEVFGTPAFMAPEQVAAGKVDRRADVWALGATLYEALTLRSPFKRETIPKTLNAIQNDALRTPSTHNRTLPTDVDVVLATALDKDPARRYSTALEFAEDLRRIREYEPIHARPAGPMLRLSRWARRYPALATAITVVFLSLVTGLLVSLRLLEREQRALTHALGRQLSQRVPTLLEEDPSVALVLGIWGAERADSYTARRALYSALDACRLRSQIHAGGARLVREVRVDPLSELALCVQSDGTLRVYNLESGEELRRWQAHDGEALELYADFETGRLLTAGVGGIVRSWSWPEGTLQAEFAVQGGDPFELGIDAEHERYVVSTPGGVSLHSLDGAPLFELPVEEGSELTHSAFFPGGGVLALGYEKDGAPRLRLQLLRAPRSSRELEVGDAPLRWVEFGPDGRELIVADAGGELRIFDVSTGELSWPLFEHDAPVSSACLSPDGERLAVTLDGETPVRAWLYPRDSAHGIPLVGHGPHPVSHAAFSPDGSLLATCGNDRTLQLHAAHDGTPLGSGWTLMRPIAIRFTPDGRRVLTRSQGNSVHVWYASGLPELYSLRGHRGPVRWAEFHPDGELAITGSDDGTARLWSTPRDRRSEDGGRTLAVLEGHGAAVERAQFGPRGEVALTADALGEVRLWTIPEGVPRGEAFALGAPLVAASFSPDGTQFTAVTGEGEAYLCATDGTGAVMMLAPGVVGASFLPDGEQVVCACEDGKLRWYRARGGALLATHPIVPEASALRPPIAMAARADGEELVVVTSDLVMHFLDARTGERAEPIDQSTLNVDSIAYSPTGEQLLVTGARGPGAYLLFDRGGGEKTRRRHEFNHRGDISCGAYSPDGVFGLTASHDGTVYVFKTETGQPVSLLALHGGAVLHASFGPEVEDLRVLTASMDGTARVWPTDPLETAQRRKPRELFGWELARERRHALPLELD